MFVPAVDELLQEVVVGVVVELGAPQHLRHHVRVTQLGRDHNGVVAWKQRHIN